MQISARPRMRARYFAAGEAMDISRQYRGGQVGRRDRALAPAAASAAASFLLAAALCTVRADAVRSVLRRSLPSGLGALVCPVPAVPVRWAVDGEAMCGGGARRPRTALPRMCRRPRVSLGRGTRSPVGVDDLACPKARGLGGVSGQRRVGCRGSWSRGGTRSRNDRGSSSGRGLAACGCGRDCDCGSNCRHDCDCDCSDGRDRVHRTARARTLSADRYSTGPFIAVRGHVL